MYKKYWRTVFGVLLACGFAFASHFATQEILEKQQNKLLSQEGYFSEEKNENREENEKDRVKLSAYELKEVLRSIEGTGREEHPEPSGRQMSKEEAVAAGNRWIEEFYQVYIGEATERELEEGTKKTAAAFGVKMPESPDSLVEEDLYAYWTVIYRMRGMDITLVLNAVTGQMLRMNAVSYDAERNFRQLQYAKNSVLTAYVDSFSLHGKNIFETNGRSVFLKLEEEGIYAGMDQDSIVTAQKDDMTEINIEGTRFNIYLTSISKNDS